MANGKIPSAVKNAFPGGPLNDRQVEVVKGRSLRQAATRAGYPNCKHPALTVIRSMGQQLSDIMDRKGYTPRKLMELHIEGLECADLTVRRHYLDMAYRLRGFYREAEEERGRASYRDSMTNLFGDVMFQRASRVEQVRVLPPLQEVAAVDTDGG